MVYKYPYVKLLDIQELSILLFMIEIIINWDVTLGVFTVKLWLIIKIIIRSDNLKKCKGKVHLSREIIYDFLGGEKIIPETYKVIQRQ